VFLPEYAWILAEEGKLSAMVDLRLVADPDYGDHWKSMERVLRVRKASLLLLFPVV
jgi:hypothetical protein